MTAKRKAAMIWGESVAAFQFHPLHLAWNGGILRLRLQDKHSLTHKPPYLAIASLKHCETMPQVCGRPSKETNQFFVLPRVDNGPTPDRHDKQSLFWAMRGRTSTSLSCRCLESGGTD